MPCDCGADGWDPTSGAWQCWGCLYDAKRGGVTSTTTDEPDVIDEAPADD